MSTEKLTPPKNWADRYATLGGPLREYFAACQREALLFAYEDAARRRLALRKAQLAARVEEDNAK